MTKQEEPRKLSCLEQDLYEAEKRRVRELNEYKKFIEWVIWDDDSDDFHFIRDYTTYKWLNADEDMKPYTTDELFYYWVKNIKK